VMFKIDVFSDVVCPWCYVGKRRLEQALKSAQWSVDFDISYLPFELNPSMSAEGVNRKEYLHAKYGDGIKGADERLKAMGQELGIAFNFDLAERIPNTFNAHRVIWLASSAGTGVQERIVDSLHEAYFTKGQDIGDREVLATVAAANGLEYASVEKLLSSDQGKLEVRKAEADAQNLGITGVPFFVLDGRVGLSGAQPQETFIRAIKSAME